MDKGEKVMYYNSTFELYYHHRDEKEVLREKVKEQEAEIKRLKDKYESTPISRLKHVYYNIITSTSDLREHVEYLSRYTILDHIEYIFIEYPDLKKQFVDLTGTSKELKQRFDDFILNNIKEYPVLEEYRHIRELGEYLGFE